MWSALLTLVVAANAPRVVVALPTPDATEAAIGFADPDAFHAVAKVHTAADFTPVGALSPDGHTAYVASVLDAKSHDGELRAVNLETGAVEVLSKHALGTERPRVSDAGDVVFLRGAGSATEVWVRRTKHAPARIASIEATTINLAGLWGEQVLLYRVDATGASIWRVPLAGGAPTRVGSLPHGPFARDFSFDVNRVIYATTISSRTKTYGVEAMDLRTGITSVLLRDASDHLAPLMTVHGLLFTTHSPDGDELMHKDDPLVSGRAFALAATRDGVFAAVRHELPERAILLRVGQGASVALSAEGRFNVLGFAEP